MALVALKDVIPIPSIPPGTGTPNVTTLQSLDATSDRLALVFKVPNGCTSITTVGFNIGTVAGASGNMVLDVRLEAVDLATGDPSGTLFGTNTNAGVTLQFNDDNKWQEITLTAPATVTPGQDIAIVLNPTSFTTVTSVIIQGFGSNDFNTRNTYSDLNNGGAGWVKSDSAMTAAIGNGSTFFQIVGTVPAKSVTTTAFNSGSSPSKRALKFQVTFPCRVVGAWIQMDFDGDAEIKLYAADGTTVLASATLDSTLRPDTAIGWFQFPFTASATLAANTNYYLSIEPTTVTDLTVYHYSVIAPATNTLLDAFPGGKNFILSTNNGSWSDDDLSHPIMGILVDAFDDGTTPAKNVIYDSTLYDTVLQ